MEGTDSTIRWCELIGELVCFSNKTQLAARLRVSFKEIGRWMKAEAHPQGRHKEAILKECDRVGLNWRKFQGLAPVYDFRITYEKNVNDGPQGLRSDLDHLIPRIPTRLWDYELNSPIGVPASILTLNSRWIEPLTKLGFDIITAKTVRTKSVPPHPVPNAVYLPDLQEPLRTESLLDQVRATTDVPDFNISRISLANSYGMPSPEPRIWQEDLRKTKEFLKRGQILIASVVGTAEAKSNDNPTQLINNFVECARLAYEVEPHAIELNFSCPNVYGREGSIYHDPEIAARICRKIEKELPGAKVLIKIGYLPLNELREFFDATYRYISGYTAINTLPAKVISDGQREEPAFPGFERVTGGVSGVAIRTYALDTVQHLRQLADDKRKELVILGVGGISSAIDGRQFLDAGASGIQICTAALFNPFIAIEIRKQLAHEMSTLSQSHLLDRAGLAVPFQDTASAKAFEVTLKISQRTGIPFETAYRALQKNWLNAYLGQIAVIESSGSPQRTRRNAPSESQIEKWVRDEYEKHR